MRPTVAIITIDKVRDRRAVVLFRGSVGRYYTVSQGTLARFARIAACRRAVFHGQVYDGQRYASELVTL